ncbi:hypothetical protein FIBSPDRAFT_896518 [Athelia psychrophila]|uniref:Uncharacterized protein n=1 Tax=Athelia psychrophila TaxID=1759441 RepID=A0A165WXK0_9AGAM|nr:hypothetical protein FIBSPDRAFT_901590 [Fibularhizoctonia sp. CBS 109695]KZP14504.1 hypothetical protein FIBSPDRAFT_896518 [Fibularhizoctonia sp. CBS 109695]
MSLYNLSGRLSNHGRQKEALTAIQEAVDLHRDLAADELAFYNADLIDSLRWLTRCFTKVGSSSPFAWGNERNYRELAQVPHLVYRPYRSPPSELAFASRLGSLLLPTPCNAGSIDLIIDGQPFELARPK